jgi:hypothetical protein
VKSSRPGHRWLAGCLAAGAAIAAIASAEEARSDRANHFPPVPAVASDFQTFARDTSLPRACDTASTTRLVVRALTAFNAGEVRTFAGFFTRTGRFNPYNGADHVGRYKPSRSGVTRRKIAWATQALHRADHGWTALSLVPPVAAESGAVYGLNVRISLRARPWYHKGVKLIVDCRSGRVRVWQGPAFTPPTP